MKQIFTCVFLLATLVSIVCQNCTTRYGYYWRDYRGSIPVDAFNVTSNLYIAQVLYDSVLIGGYYAGTGAVITEYEGHRVVVRDTIKFLCNTQRDRFKWVRQNAYSLKPDFLESMVIGGFEDNVLTYIGRIFHENQWKIGKVFPPPHPLQGLNVWTENEGRYITPDFEILQHTGECSFIDNKFVFDEQN
ncbi:hypothetical protein MML48_9g00009568 [Holotrichia oblita]|uniref:Uncharacterized protein n=1 Tax=Holotrichia oblita TaxID=644536 RepID=A0ACB9SGN5_HOLOL|nr:hypothetical protein MML48_9g00009568 [Holotrichia oblita]